MANRGKLGGLARHTKESIHILDAFGCDIILIETVGVGQSEIDIFKSAHTTLVIVVPGLGVYGITKFGVTALSENFTWELKATNSKVKVSVLLPGIVNTSIIDSGRNRPADLNNPEIILDPKLIEEYEQLHNDAKMLYSGPLSMSTKIVADIVFNAIENEVLFIFTDLATETGIKVRTEVMLNDINILKKFVEKTGQSREKFFSETMDQGYKSINY